MKSAAGLTPCVSVSALQARQLVRTERLHLTVADDGYTRIDPAGRPVDAAVEWLDLDGFYAWLVDRLCTPAAPP